MVATYRQIAMLVDARRMNANPWVSASGSPKGRKAKGGFAWAWAKAAVKEVRGILRATGSKALGMAKGVLE